MIDESFWQQNIRICVPITAQIYGKVYTTMVCCMTNRRKEQKVGLFVCCGFNHEHDALSSVTVLSRTLICRRGYLNSRCRMFPLALFAWTAKRTFDFYRLHSTNTAVVLGQFGCLTESSIPKEGRRATSLVNLIDIPTMVVQKKELVLLLKPYYWVNIVLTCSFVLCKKVDFLCRYVFAPTDKTCEFDVVGHHTSVCPLLSRVQSL